MWTGHHTLPRMRAWTFSSAYQARALKGAAAWVVGLWPPRWRSHELAASWRRYPARRRGTSIERAGHGQAATRSRRARSGQHRRAESMPKRSAITTRSKPFFSTYLQAVRRGIDLWLGLPGAGFRPRSPPGGGSRWPGEPRGSAIGGPAGAARPFKGGACRPARGRNRAGVDSAERE